MNALAHYYAAAASAFHEIFYHKLPENFFAELFRKSTAIFPEISGKTLEVGYNRFIAEGRGISSRPSLRLILWF